VIKAYQYGSSFFSSFSPFFALFFFFCLLRLSRFMRERSGSSGFPITLPLKRSIGRREKHPHELAFPPLFPSFLNFFPLPVLVQTNGGVTFERPKMSCACCPSFPLPLFYFPFVSFDARMNARQEITGRMASLPRQCSPLSLVIQKGRGYFFRHSFEKSPIR